MYGMVLMVAVTGSGDAASFGKHKGGCSGDVVVAGCTGEVVSAGCSGGGHHFLGGRGGCSGGGFLGGHKLFGKHKHSCDGGCTGAAPAGCTGSCTGAAPAPVVVAPPAPAPVAAAPCAPACEPAPVCEKEKRKGLFARLCGKKKEKECDTCAAPAPACSTCATPGAVVVPPAATTPPAAMPPVTTPAPKKAE